MQAFLGIIVIIAACWALSESRSQVEWRPLIVGLAIQFVLALLLVKVEWISASLLTLNSLVSAIEQATLAGTTFLFGFLGGGEAPYEISRTSATYLFAFRVLPQVVVFSVIIAIFWYWRILPALVKGFGWLLQKSLRVSGPMGISGASTLFLGMVETPMVIRAYLAGLSRSEFFAVMTFGMSTVAGSVMVLYGSVLSGVMPGVVGHILSASVLNIIGAVYIARTLVPGEPATDTQQAAVELKYDSLMDAVTRGTSDGLTLALNVGGMLLVLISLVALLNGVLGVFDAWGEPLSLQRMLGWLFAPVAWLIGVPWSEAPLAGSLLGTKLALNELVAYLQLVDLQDQLSASTRLILIYALCGFANFGSLGILLGGLTTLVPQRRKEFLEIAPKSLISGTFVTLITGAIIALVSSLG